MEGFPVQTEDGIVNIVDKLSDGTLVAEDGSKLRPTFDALKSEVIEAASAVEEAISEVGDVIDVAMDLADEMFDDATDAVTEPPEAEEEEVALAEDAAEAEAPEAA